MMMKVFLVLAFGWVAGYSALSADVELTQEIADRYEQMLERSPEPGAAFDRVIEWYSTEGGGLEVLQARWGAMDDSALHEVLLGMLAEEMRTPDEARTHYREALGAADAGMATVAARRLAELETGEGNFSEAAVAYERALASDALVPLDRMELMRSLALLHQRAFDDEKAMAVWRSALERFPDDAFVLEEAGEAFLASGQHDEARAAFTKLGEMVGRDPFRKVAASLRLARAEELAGNAEEAVAVFGRTLEETSEGSWINREVRARIEELFRRRDDLPGLLAFYEQRSEAFPRDPVSRAARAAVLVDLGRGDEAVEQLREATELAPEDRELRVALIQQLTDLGRSDEALTEARELARPANAPPEVLILLGNLEFETSKEAALAAWRRIAPEGTTDVAAVAQLAEIFARTGRAGRGLRGVGADRRVVAGGVRRAVANGGSAAGPGRRGGGEGECWPGSWTEIGRARRIISLWRTSRAGWNGRTTRARRWVRRWNCFPKILTC